MCLKGMGMEDAGNLEQASQIFFMAWHEAQDDFEKFISAYYYAGCQKSNDQALNWLERALEFAVKLDDYGIKSALPALYIKIAKCYELMSDHETAKIKYDLADRLKAVAQDTGPFYHGTKANLQAGDLLTPGGVSNYRLDLKMNHIYFTANIKGAGLAASLAKGEGENRVFIVEPTGEFEDDPNVTDKKFPGNMTRSYRSLEPLKIIGEVKDWQSQTPEELQRWLEKLSENQGEIIN